MEFKNILRRPLKSWITESSAVIGLFNVVANSTAIVLYCLPFYIFENVTDSIHLLHLFIIGFPGIFYLPVGIVLSGWGLLRACYELLTALRGQHKVLSMSLKGIFLNLLAISLFVIWSTLLNLVPSGWVYSY